MDTKRILTVNKIRSLLMDGIEDLLGLHGTNFEVVSTFTYDLPDLIHQVEQIKPNVIIMEEIPSFIKPADLIASLLCIGNMRLIVVNGRTSKIDIYDRGELAISQLDHFFEALNSEAAPFLL